MYAFLHVKRTNNKSTNQSILERNAMKVTVQQMYILCHRAAHVQQAAY